VEANIGLEERKVTVKFKYKIGQTVMVRRSGNAGPWIKTVITGKMLGMGAPQYTLRAFGKRSYWYPEEWLKPDN